MNYGAQILHDVMLLNPRASMELEEAAFLLDRGGMIRLNAVLAERETAWRAYVAVHAPEQLAPPKPAPPQAAGQAPYRRLSRADVAARMSLSGIAARVTAAKPETPTVLAIPVLTPEEKEFGRAVMVMLPGAKVLAFVDGISEQELDRWANEVLATPVPPPTDAIPVLKLSPQPKKSTFSLPSIPPPPRQDQMSLFP